MAGLIKRNNVYHALYYVGTKQKRVSLRTTSLKVAKEKLRQLASALYRGNDNPLPTKTPIEKVIAAYVESMRSRKTERSVTRDIAYLRDAFGPICPELALKNPKISAKSKRHTSRHAPQYIEAPCFEQITTADISTFISVQVRRKGLAPKTANRIREILTRLFNWAMSQYGITVYGDKNPAALVERYREKAPEICFLSLDQIDQQMKSLQQYPDLQVMVAVFIYGGLRREELCWLTVDDVDFSAGNYGMMRIRAKTVNKESWEPKTKKNRVVPISRRLRQYLDSYTIPKVEGGWFFTTPTGKRWDPDNLSRYLRKINAAAGLEWACLDFRHTFGSQLAMKGESLYKISTIMGNSPEICRKHYAALIPEALVDSVEFPGDLQPSPPADPCDSGSRAAEIARPQLRLVVNNG